MQNRDLELKMLEELMANMDSRMAGRAMPQGGQITDREMSRTKPSMAGAMGLGQMSEREANMMGEDEMTRKLRAAMGR